MDPSRSLQGRGALLSSSVHAAAGVLVVVVVLLLLTLLRLPLSISRHAASTVADQELSQPSCDPTSPLDCADPQLFHLMMRSAIDAFPAVHFSRFGRPVPGDPPSASCDMAWRARSDSDSPSKATSKDYRRFAIARDPHTCAYSVLYIGDYHSGPNARKPRRAATIAPPPPPSLSHSQFAQGAYLAYLGGGDRCKPMPHYLRSLLCALAEARYLNRTLVLDLTLCLAASYDDAGTGPMPEEGKRLAFYVDVEHLHSQGPIIEESQFWADWDKWGVQGQLGARLIEDTRLAPMKFSKARDTLLVRKFGDVEPGNYWYNVCEGEAKRVFRPLRRAIRWAPNLMRIVDDIVSRMQADFDSVHIGANGEHLSRRIEEGVDGGRQVYVAGAGVNTTLLEALKVKFGVHYLDEYEDLWGTDSKWFLEMKRLNGGVPVQFDGYMREVVDREVFLKGKKKVEVLR
ncbi:uncharacterized protein LOC133897215 [Phragmites australis]|uniref:uncharacterized protein LOC133897215 n=1 Tax=Phragmites australis TaxID=29695 RepID=UPI002D76D07B|nr:uncharacterized protein LOC133897215 [Phragmites australis]